MSLKLVSMFHVEQLLCFVCIDNVSSNKYTYTTNVDGKRIRQTCACVRVCVCTRMRVYVCVEKAKKSERIHKNITPPL